MWNVAVEPRAPMARCHECGSPEVFALCHHCWRPGCAKHVRPSPRWARRLLRREGSGPGLAKAPAYHCGDCTHRKNLTTGVTGRWAGFGVAGAVLVLAGISSVGLNLMVGAALLLAGVVCVAGAWLRVSQVSARKRARLPVPLLPRAVDVELTEELRGQIRLGGESDEYQTVLEPVQGRLNMLLTFGGPDKERVRRWRRLLHAPDATVPWCAGRVVLPGPFGIRADEHVTGPVLPLEGDSGDYQVFRPQDAPSSSPWKYELGYQLRTEPEITAGPIWITPSIVPESDRHGLELDIQWVKFGPDEDKPLTLRMIELLRLEFPVSWGEIHAWIVHDKDGDQPRATTGLLGERRRSIELKRITPPDKTRSGTRASHLTLAIQFADEVDPKQEIAGRITAEMNGVLSGITGVRLFDSLGGERALGKRASLKTRIDLTFQLSLASIRYQALRVEPDRAAEDTNRDGYADVFPVIPDDETVIALTNAMSDENYYVKHVIENPPRSGRRANELQRYWDIAGRRYIGVYPIDFHIILTGEEVHGGGIRPDRGSTKVRIVVKGAYTDDEMGRLVREEYKRLRDLTSYTLGLQESVASQAG